MWQRYIDEQVRLWIRRKMFRHQLKAVFEMINEEYQRVYSEDNFPTRQDFLHELVDITDPGSYMWGKFAAGDKQAAN